MTQPGSPPPIPQFPPPPPYGQAPYAAPQPVFIPVPRSGGGFARAIFTALAVAVLGGSLTLNVWLLILLGAFSGTGTPLHTTTIHEGDAKNTIALVPVTGEINASTASDIEIILRELEKDADLKAVVLEINTPGGEVTASDQIYARVLQFRATRKIPVIASMGALATSGGYYVACAADQIVAQRTTWTGNIGVLLPQYNVAELAEKYGVKDLTLRSNGTPFKDAGSPTKPEEPEQRAYLQKLVDDAFAQFKGVVVKGRNLPAADVNKVANGKVYTGDDALKLKLVDAIGYADDAIALAAKQAGISSTKPQSVRYERKKGLFEALGASGELPANRPVARFDVAGVGVNVDRATLDRVLSPRPLYLWQAR